MSCITLIYSEVIRYNIMSKKFNFCTLCIYSPFLNSYNFSTRLVFFSIRAESTAPTPRRHFDEIGLWFVSCRRDSRYSKESGLQWGDYHVMVLNCTTIDLAAMILNNYFCRIAKKNSILGCLMIWYLNANCS